MEFLDVIPQALIMIFVGVMGVAAGLALAFLMVDSFLKAMFPWLQANKPCARKARRKERYSLLRELLILALLFFILYLFLFGERIPGL